MSDSGAWTGDDQEEAGMPMAVVRGPFAAMLPARSVRLIAEEDRVERMEARRAERERAESAERRHDEAVASWKQQAQLSGEQVSVMDILSGGVGVTVSDVLERARAQSEAQDAYAAKWRPDGCAPDAIMFSDLQDLPKPAARSATGRAMADRLRHWRDRVEARRRADELDGPVSYRSAVQPAEAARARYEAACREIGCSPAVVHGPGERVAVRPDQGVLSRTYSTGFVVR